MKTFKESRNDDVSIALKLAAEIEKAIKIKVSKREHDQRKTTGPRIHIDQFLPQENRAKFSSLAAAYISKTPGFSRGPSFPSGRSAKDVSFSHESIPNRGVYIRNRPDGKRSAAGTDPNELMTAALCLLPNLSIPTDVEEMDALIEQVKKLVKTNKIVGATRGQIASLDKDYSNLCKAVSAAVAIHSHNWGNCDKAYLTGQSWDNEVKRFQITRYGMKDFNSSDFILKKKDSFLGVSLKKKTRITESDPTLINKSFSSLLDGKEFDKVRDRLDDKTSRFYLELMYDEELQKSFPVKVLEKIQTGKPNKTNWKKFINDIPNSIINRALKGRESLFKDISEVILDNKDLFANRLMELIFKSSLSELKKVNFDFTLVTGIGDYGIRKGVEISPGDYTSLNTMTTALNELARIGSVSLQPRSDVKQAFDADATSAILEYVLSIGNVPICYIKLRYKGNFSAAPSFLAEMTPEFKKLVKNRK
jgi:hypothetical protein